MQSTSWETQGWKKHKLESRLPGEISITSYMQMTPLFMAESEELKSLLMKVKEESEKVGLKQHSENEDHGIWSHHFMANRWETVADFIIWGSKVNADGDCSQEIKGRLLLGRKVRTNLDSILKSRDITLPTKVHLGKAMVFPVVMYGCELDCEESWAPKNWCFWTMVGEDSWQSLALQGGPTSPS